jgi:hypothetical protein
MGTKRPYDEMASPTSSIFPQPRAFQPAKIVTLLVGPDEQAMVVHGDCLSRDSAFFKAALKKEWGDKRSIKLPDETPLIMGYYIEHMNGFELPTHTFTTGPSIRDPEQPAYELLANLYVLGERMLDPKYQNKIMHEFFRLVHFESSSNIQTDGTSWLGAKAVNIIYQGTTTGCPARRMLVNFAANKGHFNHLGGTLALDPGYLLNFGGAMLQKVQKQGRVRDFRGLDMDADEYLVDENT